MLFRPYSDIIDSVPATALESIDMWYPVLICDESSVEKTDGVISILNCVALYPRKTVPEADEIVSDILLY